MLWTYKKFEQVTILPYSPRIGKHDPTWIWLKCVGPTFILLQR